MTDEDIFKKFGIEITKEQWPLLEARLKSHRRQDSNVKKDKWGNIVREDLTGREERASRLSDLDSIQEDFLNNSMDAHFKSSLLSNDLQHKLKLSYCWLEPLSRTNLATVVATRTPREPLPKTVFDFPEWQGER